MRRAGVPIVVADLGLSDAEAEVARAMLLAAWFPGYLCSQIPGAALIQAIGPKIVMGLNTAGVCGFFMLLPWLARLGRSTAGSVRIMAACLTVCGFCQVLLPLSPPSSSPRCQCALPAAHGAAAQTGPAHPWAAGDAAQLAPQAWLSRAANPP